MRDGARYIGCPLNEGRVGAFYAVEVGCRYMYFDDDNIPGLAFYIDADTPGGRTAGNCS